MSGPVSFRSVPADAYPFTVTVFDGGGEVLWQLTVEGPGVLQVPGFGGRAALVRVTYANGRETWDAP